ncbi:hypothetical protein HMPREF0063_11361 [Aeromicrobium marinum DSM 15272]|uniref:Uncharacterized protein n=1 Tax=Aeromicrobium marinum DSM 15272 TaxID=585531 RepID=E2SBF2_9ACTN|nr:hypothetical protein HMPREF0063_11361 [Aeromicrobium marinum DSM 15272]
MLESPDRATPRSPRRWNPMTTILFAGRDVVATSVGSVTGVVQLP